MPHKQVVEYIKDSLQKNASRKEITDALTKAGWHTRHIDEAFASLQNQPRGGGFFSFMRRLIRRQVLIPLAFFLLIIAGGIYSFMRPGPGSLAPVVSANEAFVPVNLPIKIAFDYGGANIEDIKRYLRVTPETAVNASFDGKILTLEHEKNLRYDTEYTITIGKDIPLGFGRKLGQDFTLSFRTKPRNQARTLPFDPYNTFQFYALNYYDHDYEVQLLPQKAGQYVMTVYKTTPETLLDAFFFQSEYDYATNSFKKRFQFSGTPADTQTITVKEHAAFPYIPKITEPGVYYVQAQNAANKNETYSFFVTLTKHALASKRLGDKLVTWVVDQRTSSASPNVQVKAIGNKKDEILYTETTNAKGLIENTISQEEEAKKPSVLQLQSGNDVTFAFIDVQWFGSIYQQDYSNRLQQYKAFVYSDRPLYTPGDTVHFKAILRENDKVFYRPVAKSVTVKAQEITYGQEANVIFEKTLSANQNGTIADSFALPKEAKSGEYTITVQLGGQEIGHSLFNIEFYEKPEFEVGITANREKVVSSETIKAQITGKYFFGDAAKGADVHWRLHSIFDETYKEGDVRLDENGAASVDIKTDGIKVPEWYSYYGNYEADGLFEDPAMGGVPITIEATVTDKAGRVSVKRKILTFFDSQYALTLKKPENIWNLKANQDYRFVFEARDYVTLQPVKGWPVEMTLSKIEWKENSYEPAETVVKKLDLPSDGIGRLEFDLLFPSVGSYRIQVVGKDALGNEVKKVFDIWVPEETRAGVSGRTKESVDRISISPDKSSYRVGENALITLELPRPSGDLFWSVNQKTFKQIHVEAVETNKKELRLPITEEMAGGFYLHASLFQDDAFAKGTQLIKVTGKRLSVEVSSARPKNAPGQEVALTITTKDELGNPVSAEASLSVVDKAIFALKNDQTEDIYDAFYPEVQDLLESRDSLEVISISLAEFGACFLEGTKVLMADGSWKAIEDIQVGDYILTRDSKFGGRLVPDKVTEVFEHLVNEYLLITHDQGSLKVTGIHPVLVNDAWKNAEDIKIGDKLLTNEGAKVTVRSITPIKTERLVKVYNFKTFAYHTFFADGIYVHNSCGGKGGGNEEEDCVRNNFLDTAYWNAFISTGSNGQATVKVALPDNLTTWVAFSRAVTRDTKVGQGDTELTVSKDLIIRPVLPQFIRSGDKLTVNATIHNNTAKADRFKVLMRAQGANLLDESIKTINIGLRETATLAWNITVQEQKSATFVFSVTQVDGNAKDEVELTVPVYANLSAWSAALSGNGASSFDFALHPAASKKYSSAVFSLTPSTAAALPQIIDKLSGYPYGCVEQTMSKQLPNILAASHKDLLGTSYKEDALRAGFERLQQFQHADGGFGWWETDENNIWMSGYVLEGLHEAKKVNILGTATPVYDRLLAYLKTNGNGLGDEERIYANYVISKIEPARTKAFAQSMGDEIINGKALDSQSKGYVALTLFNAGDSAKAKAVLAKVMEDLQTDHWEMPTTYDYHGSLKDKYSATGLNLLALVTIDNNPEISQKIVAWLMRNRNGYDGLWGSTRQSSQILFGLLAYLGKTNELKPSFTYQVYLNNQLVKSERVTDSRYVLRLELPVEKLKETNSLQITQDGTGNIYWSLLVNNYVPGEKVTVSNPDLSIQRQYSTLQGKTLANFATGDIVKVRLTVTSKKEFSYVLIEDFLPAGLEAQNPRLENSAGRARAGDIYLGEWYDSLDIRDERVALFRRNVGPGTHTFEYLARASHKGEFTAPSTRIEPMYAPDQASYGQTSKVVVK